MNSRTVDRDRDRDTPQNPPKSSRKSFAPQPSTVKKRAVVVAAMTSTELTDTCKENVAALLKLKVAKTLELARREMDLIRRLEKDAAASKGAIAGAAPDGSSIDAAESGDDKYADIGDGMGEFPLDHPTQPRAHGTHNTVASIIPLSPRSKKHADEALITDLMSLSAQHIQLCRNMEDRFNTAILNTNDFSNL